MLCDISWLISLYAALTVPKVRLQLAQEEQENYAKSVTHDDMPPSIWINLGMELEDQQSVIILVLAEGVLTLFQEEACI